MKLFVIVLFLVGLTAAVVISPEIYGIKDTGEEDLPEVDVEFTFNCDTNNLNIQVTDDEGPVENAEIYLFYTDYGYNPLPGGGKTNADGFYVLKVTGNIQFLTGLFILRVDSDQHKAREIEFSLLKCLEELECSEDADCADNEKCEGNDCVMVPCACGEVSDHYCYEYECCSDNDCETGYECLDNVCLEETVPEPEEPEIQEPEEAPENESGTTEEVTPPQQDIARICPFAFVLASLVVLLWLRT